MQQPNIELKDDLIISAFTRLRNIEITLSFIFVFALSLTALQVLRKNFKISKSLFWLQKIFGFLSAILMFYSMFSFYFLYSGFKNVEQIADKWFAYSAILVPFMHMHLQFDKKSQLITSKLDHSMFAVWCICIILMLSILIKAFLDLQKFQKTEKMGILVLIPFLFNIFALTIFSLIVVNILNINLTIKSFSLLNLKISNFGSMAFSAFCISILFSTVLFRYLNKKATGQLPSKKDMENLLVNPNDTIPESKKQTKITLINTFI